MIQLSRRFTSYALCGGLEKNGGMEKDSSIYIIISIASVWGQISFFHQLLFYPAAHPGQQQHAREKIKITRATWNWRTFTRMKAGSIQKVCGV